MKEGDLLDLLLNTQIEMKIDAGDDDARLLENKTHSYRMSGDARAGAETSAITSQGGNPSEPEITMNSMTSLTPKGIVESKFPVPWYRKHGSEEARMTTSGKLEGKDGARMTTIEGTQGS